MRASRGATDPFLFFAAANRYVQGPDQPADRLVRLKRLVNECHARGLQVIMDGVFNHVDAGLTPDTGFPYYWLYQDPTDSPFIGQFADAAFFEDFDFANGCTQEFVRDVCRYWLDTFQLDGIRFDYTRGLHEEGIPGSGLGR